MRRQRLRNRPFPNKRSSDQYTNSNSSDEERGGAAEANHSLISTIPSIMAVVMLNPNGFGAGITRQSSSQQGIKLKYESYEIRP